jgi:predicted DCC family thiol-disulfide oxidoreductase YuxK
MRGWIGARSTARSARVREEIGMEAPPHLTPHDRVVLFDGVCRLCSGWSRFLLRRDRARRLKLCRVQSPEGQAILAWFGFPTDHYGTMIYIEGGRAHVRTDGILRVLAQLPRPWPWLRVARIVPAPVRDWLYDRVALNRYRLFGRYDACVAPDADVRSRFIDHE